MQYLLCVYRSVYIEANQTTKGKCMKRNVMSNIIRKQPNSQDYRETIASTVVTFLDLKLTPDVTQKVLALRKCELFDCKKV